jgi:hypothetical protein
MQRLSTLLSDVLPDIVSDAPLSSDATEKVKKITAELKGLAHNIKKESKSSFPPDSDPSLAFLSTLFEKQINLADSALKGGNTEYAKNSLRMVTSYCISCHTRTDQGPSFPSLPLSPKTKSLSPFAKAQLFAATRQFDRSLSEFEKIIKDKSIASQQPIDWGKAVRHAFTLSIRVKQDPIKTEQIMKDIKSLPATPELFREFTKAWETSIAQWKGESKKTFENELALLQEAERLLKKAEGMQKYPLDHSADIEYLRVSVLAHEILSRFPQGTKTAEALLLAGTAYDVLGDRLISPLPELYYEACIEKSPKTPVAKTCYSRYKSNIDFGYTGSSGTSIPEDISTHLKNLAKQSGAEPPVNGENP